MAVILAHVRIPSWGGAFIRPKKPIDMILSPLAQVTGIGLSPKCTTPRKVSQNPLVIPTNKKGLNFQFNNKLIILNYWCHSVEPSKTRVPRQDS